MVVVLAIIGVMASLALPSWRSAQLRGISNDARTVLERLDLQQKRYWQRYARYASAAELPALVALSDTVAMHYELSVELTPGGYRLSLLSRNADLSSVGLTHWGLWTQFPAEGSQ
jgi:Tfp pilus assembly protein PilE